MINVQLMEEANFEIVKLQKKRIVKTTEILKYMKKHTYPIPRSKLEEVYQYFGATRKSKDKEGKKYDKHTGSIFILVAEHLDGSTAPLYLVSNDKLKKKDEEFIEQTLNVTVITINDTLKQLVSM